jgi:hypothetical protein
LKRAWSANLDFKKVCKIIAKWYAFCHIFGWYLCQNGARLFPGVRGVKFFNPIIFDGHFFSKTNSCFLKKSKKKLVVKKMLKKLGKFGKMTLKKY